MEGVSFGDKKNSSKGLLSMIRLYVVNPLMGEPSPYMIYLYMHNSCNQNVSLQNTLRERERERDMTYVL